MRYILAVVTLFLFMGCDKDIEIINTNNSDTATSNSDTSQEGNKPPIADAGPNKTVSVGKSVDINGSGTDEDGHIVDYEWKEGSVLVSGLKSFSYTGEKEGNYTLTLTVMDDDGATGQDTMQVTVTK